MTTMTQCVLIGTEPDWQLTTLTDQRNKCDNYWQSIGNPDTRRCGLTSNWQPLTLCMNNWQPIGNPDTQRCRLTTNWQPLTLFSQINATSVTTIDNQLATLTHKGADWQLIDNQLTTIDTFLTDQQAIIDHWSLPPWSITACGIQLKTGIHSKTALCFENLDHF